MKYWTGFACAFAVLAIAAHAQNYPAHDIKMIVPFPAGGPSDTVARIVAEGMSRHLGQQVVVENVGGAGGTLGATRASEAAPDGYTIMAASMGTVIAAPSFYPNLKYDSTKDFEPIGMTANAPAAIAIKASIPAKNVKEFVEWAKKEGPNVKQAFGGVGGTSHMISVPVLVASPSPTSASNRSAVSWICGKNDVSGSNTCSNAAMDATKSAATRRDRLRLRK